jgi:ketosteroid isomerase-like protein
VTFRSTGGVRRGAASSADPGGRRSGGPGSLTGRDAAGEVQREWFGDPDWSWDVELLHSTSAGDTGVALPAVDYRDVDAGGRPYAMVYLLGLVFARVDGRWLLLHDQNTVR